LTLLTDEREDTVMDATQDDAAIRENWSACSKTSGFRQKFHTIVLD